MLSAGLHGVEGYAGVALLDLFVHEFLPRVDATTTSLYLIPVINPWGMKHLRRVNPNNVDLNRNFLRESEFATPLNPEYARLAPFLHPERPVTGWDRFRFYVNVVRCFHACGNRVLAESFPRGQSIYPQGLYYTGTELQPESRYVIRLLEAVIGEHERVIHMDMPTGFGARGALMLVFPAQGAPDEEELRALLRYEHITKVAAANFYPILGDLSAYTTEVLAASQAGRVFTFALEYGTFGNGLLAQLRSLRAMMLENQLYWYGSSTPRVAQWVRREFLELFYPSDPGWRAQMVTQARTVFRNVIDRL